MAIRSSPRTDLVRRDRLISRLHRALARRGAALIAGPGYGKTTLLSLFVVEYAHPWVWCDLAEHREDAVAWVRQLVRDVELANPGVDLAASYLLRGAHATIDDARLALDQIATSESALLSGPLLIVIDDFQVARPGSDLEVCIGHLLRQLPSQWRMIVASRGEPSSPELARLIQYGEIEPLTEVDLAFTIEETVTFLMSDRPPDLARTHAGWVQSLVAGWPAGIAPVSRSLPPNGEARPDAIAVDPVTYRYFARTVLDEVEPSLQDFLLRSSVLPFVGAALCDDALGRSDSAQCIHQLASRHLFLLHRPSQPGTYRLHVLFREFLLAEAQSQLSPDVVRALHRRAARHLLADGHAEEAAGQLIAASDWAGLSALLRVHGAAMVYAGQAATVLRWLESVPTEAFSESPWLLLYRGYCLRTLDLPGDLRSIQRRAQLLFARAGERIGRAQALAEEANAVWLTRNVAEAAALASEALSIAAKERSDGATRVRIEILGSLMFYQLMLGRIEDARAAGHEALGLLPRIQDAATRTVHHVIIQRQLGLAYALGGDFHTSLVFLRQACEIARPREVNEQTRARAFYVRGYVAILRGDFDDAFLSFEETEKVARDANLTDHVRRVRATRALIFATLGQMDAAEEQLRQAQWFADEWVDPAYFYYRSGRHRQTIDLCEGTIAVCGPASNPMHRARAQALLGVSLIALGTAAAGRQLLEQALATYRASGFFSRVPGIALQLANVAFAEGRTDEGDSLLAEALGIAHRGGAHHFFVFHPAVLQTCVQRARALDYERQFVAAIEERWPDLRVQAGAGYPAAPDTTDRSFPYRDLLEPCADERIRADLALALTEGRVTPQGIKTLRSECGLTWREVQIFVRYYLPRPSAVANSTSQSTRRRLDLAAELGVTEFTIRYHISAIRSKIGVIGQRSLAVYDWAIGRAITG